MRCVRFPSVLCSQIIVLTLCLSQAFAQNPQTRPVRRAADLISQLTDEQRTKAVLPFESENRVQWHFIPMASRKGLPLMEMTQPQRQSAMDLLRACLSQEGFQKATDIMELEKLLKQIEGGGSMERNSEKYYFTIFGTPERDQRWGLSVEGHHLSLNFVFQGNRIIDSTPQFYAANPARLMADYNGFEQGTEVLKPEQSVALQLVTSLTPPQLEKAKLPGETPRELHNAATPQPVRDLPKGIQATELDNAQQESLRQLLTAYTAKMKQRVAEERWSQIEEAGFDNVYFGWSGGMQSGQKHYYVVQGPTFVVEYINVQPDAAGNPANHIHCVWRDMTGDFDLPVN